MNKEQVNSILELYVKEHLSPTQWGREQIAARYAQLRGFLKGQGFQTGSYARFTSKRPVNDLDVIWQLPDSFREKDIRKTIDPTDLNPSHILSDLARHLEDEYRRANITVRIKAQTHSVGIYFGPTDDEFSIDLVPAVATGEQNEYDDDIFWVPEIARLSKSHRLQRYHNKSEIQWIKSDPKGYITDASLLNAENPAFRKVAKFVRRWRSGCKKQSPNLPLKSFHLELIVNDLFKEEHGLTSIDAVRRFFDTGWGKYLIRPSFVDRAHEQQYVDAYVGNITDEEYSEIVAFTQGALSLLSSITTLPDSTSVTNALDVLLSGYKSTSLSLQHQQTSPIPIDDSSHKQELYEAGIYDQGTPYPCTAIIKAGLYFRGPRDKKINMRYQRAAVSDTLLPVWHWIKFEVKTDSPDPYDVYWQVVNTGAHAASQNGLRGEIIKGSSTQMEHSQYTGKHWIEAFIVTRQGVCIARSNPFYVNFINPAYPILAGKPSVNVYRL